MAELTNFLKWWIEFTYENWLMTCIFIWLLCPHNEFKIDWTNRKGDE